MHSERCSAELGYIKCLFELLLPSYLLNLKPSVHFPPTFGINKFCFFLPRDLPLIGDVFFFRLFSVDLSHG